MNWCESQTTYWLRLLLVHKRVSRLLVCSFGAYFIALFRRFRLWRASFVALRVKRSAKNVISSITQTNGNRHKTKIRNTRDQSTTSAFQNYVVCAARQRFRFVQRLWRHRLRRRRHHRHRRRRWSVMLRRRCRRCRRRCRRAVIVTAVRVAGGPAMTNLIDKFRIEINRAMLAFNGRTKPGMMMRQRRFDAIFARHTPCALRRRDCANAKANNNDCRDSQPCGERDISISHKNHYLCISIMLSKIDVTWWWRFRRML